MITIHWLNMTEVLAAAEEFTTIYRLAFGPPPYHATEQEAQMFARSLPSHSGRKGFLCAAAFDTINQRYVGIAYGYLSQPGQWWHDQIQHALTPEQTFWLDDAFELVELAVIPAYQGQGIGSQLHDHLYTVLPQRHALLSTIQADTVAYQLTVAGVGKYYGGVFILATSIDPS